MCCHSKLCASTANYVTQAPSAPQYRADDYSPPPSNAASDDDADYDEREHADTDWLTLCDGAFEDPSTLIRRASDGDEPPTLADVMLTVLDWFASHKATYRSTEDVYRLLALVVPAGTSVGTFNQMRVIVDRHKLESCHEYDACPKGCIVYKDFSGRLAEHQYAAMTSCPKCQTPRYAGLGAYRRASHRVHFFPIARYLNDMFQRPDMEDMLDHRPTDRIPDTSVKKSRGYRDKILRDTNMNADHRNQGIVLSADGIPYFGAADKHSRGAWPVVARLASLPDGLWDRFEFAHLYALEATEHWYTEPESGRARRKRKWVVVLVNIIRNSSIHNSI